MQRNEQKIKFICWKYGNSSDDNHYTLTYIFRINDIFSYALFKMIINGYIKQSRWRYSELYIRTSVKGTFISKIELNISK